MQFSVCVIVKNEEKNIVNCLKPLSTLGYEIVVVDTGSTDDTVKLAKDYTDMIYQFEWIDDFAAAKNYAISKATNDFVFVIDADEYLVEFDKKFIEDFFVQNPEKVGRLKRIEHIVMDNGQTNKGVSYTNRFFDRRVYRFHGAIHEQLVRNDYRNKTYETSVMPAVVDHMGYYTNQEQKKEKSQRNIDILKSELKKCILDDDRKEEIPYFLYQLGQSYYFIKDYQSAREYFSKAMDYDLDPKLEYVVNMVISYGYTLLNLQRYGEAMMLENIYDAFSTSSDFVYLMAHIYMNNVMFDKAIAQFDKATNFDHSNVAGINSYLSYYNIGMIYEVTGDKKNAIKYYQKASKDYQPAKQRLDNLK